MHLGNNLPSFYGSFATFNVRMSVVHQVEIGNGHGFFIHDGYFFNTLGSTMSSLSHDIIIHLNKHSKHLNNTSWPTNNPNQTNKNLLYSKYLFTPQCSGNMPVNSKMGLLVSKMLDFLYLMLNLLHLNKIYKVFK